MGLYRLRKQKRYQLRGRETRTWDISSWSFPLWQVVHFISFFLKMVSWNPVQTIASPVLRDLETWQKCDTGRGWQVKMCRLLVESNCPSMRLKKGWSSWESCQKWILVRLVYMHMPWWSSQTVSGSQGTPGESAEPHWAQRKIRREWPVSHKSSQSDPQFHVSSPSSFSKCLRRDLWLLLVWVISFPYLDSALEIMWPISH